MSCSVAITVDEWEDQSTVNSAWAGALVAIIALLMLSFFLRRPIELWPLPCLLDCLGVVCGIAGVVGICQAQSEYAWGFASPLYVLPVTAMAGVIVLFIGTAIYAWRLHRQRVKEREPSDPLKPYLMKKEIDVW
jgi:drug/metabolite transporter (DMT)-like permease